MFATIIILLLFFLEIFLFVKKSKYFVQYTFLYATSITFISYKLNFVFANQGMLFFYFATLLMLVLKMRHFNKHLFFIILSIVAMFFYLVFLYLYRDADLTSDIDFIKHYYWGVLLFVVVSNYNVITINKFNNFLIWFVILFSALGITQFVIPDVSDFFSIDMTKFGAKNQDIFLRFIRVTGYVLKPANYGNFMAILITYIYSILISTKKTKKTLYITVLILGIIATTLTGIRTSLFSLLIGLLLSSLVYNKRWLLGIISFAIIFYMVFWASILDLGKHYDKSKETDTPLSRIANAIYLSETEDVTKITTLKVSDYIIDEFYKSPTIGTGIKINNIQGLSITDAYLLYHIVRFGILGLLIILFPYLYLLYLYRNNKYSKIILILFLILILQTITDSGIFSNFSNPAFWIILGVVFSKKKKYELS